MSFLDFLYKSLKSPTELNGRTFTFRGGYNNRPPHPKPKVSKTHLLAYPIVMREEITSQARVNTFIQTVLSCMYADSP
jgi:hypothetical protein